VHPQAMAFLALDIANERVREAELERLAHRVRGTSTSGVRRIASRAAASLGIALARAAIQLDQRAAEPIRARLIADRREAFETEHRAAA
jgi:hypothetical protein